MIEMEQITINEAIRLFMENNRAVHSDGLILRQWEVENMCLRGWEDDEYTCYKWLGCVIIVMREYSRKPVRKIYKFHFYIHQIALDADIVTVLNHMLEYDRGEGAGYFMEVFACAPLPESIEHRFNRRIYTCPGNTDTDVAIRILTKADAPLVKALCDDTCQSNHYYDNVVANDFCEMGGHEEGAYWNNGETFTVLGAFDGEQLVGLVTAGKDSKINMACVHNLFVHPIHRRKGWARRLVRAAMGLYPELEYKYGLDKDNVASIATALSAGFALAGATFWCED